MEALHRGRVKWAEIYCLKTQRAALYTWLDEVLPGRHEANGWNLGTSDVVFNCRTTMKPQNVEKMNDPGILANQVAYTELEGRRVMHVPGLTVLLNMKTGLCLTMRQARERLGPDIGTGYPDCFFLPQHAAELRRWAQRNPDRYIIYKHAMDAGGSSQFLFKMSTYVDSNHFKQQEALLAANEPPPDPKKQVVVQTYVERPVLKSGYKTDLRLFGGILFDPPRVYLSRLGVYKSCNSTPDHYRLDESTLNNRRMHLSNAQISDPQPEQVAENEFMEGEYIWGTLRQWFRHLRREGRLDPDEVWLNILEAATKPALAAQRLVTCRSAATTGEAADAAERNWVRRQLSLNATPATEPQPHTCGATWQDYYVDLVVDEDGRATIMEIHVSDGNFKAARTMFRNRLLAQYYNIAALTGFGIGIADLINPQVCRLCLDHVHRAQLHGVLPHNCSLEHDGHERPFGLPGCLGRYEHQVLIRLATEYHYARQRDLDSALPTRWRRYRQLMRRSATDTQQSWHELIYHTFDRSGLPEMLTMRGINPLVVESLFTDP